MRTAFAIDRQLALAVVGLAAFGLLTLYSAGQTDVPTRAAGVWYRQFFWAGAGLVVGWAAFRVSPRILEWLAPLAYAFALVLLGVVLVVGTGAGTAASSKSWLTIGGHKVGQPAELAKVAVVLMLARYLSGRRQAPRSLRDLIVPGLLVGVPLLLVMAQPDLGSAIVFVGIGFAMLFWAGTPPRYLILLTTPVVSLFLAFNTAAWILWMLALTLMIVVWRPLIGEGLFFWLGNAAAGIISIQVWQKLEPYQQNRLLTFLNPEVDPQRAGYHAIQSKVAIGSGGWLGAGYTQGPQKRLAFLPEQHTDFAFSVVGEELGFVGVSVALLLFLTLFLNLVKVARRASDGFASLVAFGIAGMLFTHVFENVGMTVNIMPITGIPLPFFSYGGSFFLICCLCMGMAFRVADESRLSGYLD